MRKLKGGQVKETAKQKKQRKEDFAKSREQISTVVLPVILLVIILIGLYVYSHTRPSKVLYQDN